MATIDIAQDDLNAIYACQEEDDVLAFLESKNQQDVFRLVLQLQEMLKTQQLSDEQRRKLYTTYRRGQFIMENRRDNAFRLKKIMAVQKESPPT